MADLNEPAEHQEYAELNGRLWTWNEARGGYTGPLQAWWPGVGDETVHTDHPSPRTSLAHGIMQPMPALGVSTAEAAQGVPYLQAALRRMANEDPRIDQYEQERADAIELAHKAMASSYIGAPPPGLRGDADRMVAALLKAGWTPPNTDTQTVFVLTGWSSCADSINFGPRVFVSHRSARRFADETFFVGVRGWWKQTADRWIKWADSKHHERGFLEILARTVEVDHA